MDFAYDVLLRAEAVCEKETGIAGMIDGGMSAETIVENGGYF